ncbi:MAG: hypothetical protein KAI47_12505 [Deltaproteobacteria bacterium]|nr:hypothetical protein [Deltaproteobacteria bacterium]
MTIGPEVAKVKVRFTFLAHSALATLPLAFPEDRRDPPLWAFELRSDGDLISTRRVAGGAGRGFLPLAKVSYWHEAILPGLKRDEKRIVTVRYIQRLDTNTYRYLLRTGAYWRGPIGHLVTTIHLAPGVQVLRATLDGKEPKSCHPQRRLTWTFTDLEPRSDLLLSWIPKSSPHKPAPKKRKD